MVAVRDHSTFEGAPVQTAGVIETKQFTSAVAAGAAKAEELRKMSGPKVNSGLARISQLSWSHPFPMLPDSAADPSSVVPVSPASHTLYHPVRPF